MKSGLLFFCWALPLLSAYGDPQTTSWLTQYSTKYARIYTTDAKAAAGTSVTTWTNGSLTQSLPVYAGIQGISYSDSWVYIKTPDLPPYVIGPWYNDASRTTIFVNYPVNQNISYRIPRTSTLGTPPSTKTRTMGQEDAIGYFVDGVAIFDPTDGYSYANGTETSPGTGQWHRAAYVNESITFDYGNSHQQNTGKYHNHANPIALRYLLNDHIAFDPLTKKYSESTDPVTQHSPLLGWMRDGYPIYGPYGYSNPMDATSGVRRMVPGFVLRSGSTPGVDNIATVGRTLPAWALRNNGNISATGPAVSTSYPLGRYIEDWAYLGDIINPSTGSAYQLGVDFDLNEYNVRYCVTPEFPQGTYAYFIALDSTGTPQFPYNTNCYFFGNPTGGTVTSSTETTTTLFTGGTNFQETATAAVNNATGDLTLTWSSLEGGTYKVEASTDMTNWSTLTGTQAATTNAVQTSYVESAAALNNVRKFYRVSRTALATYDTGTSSSGTSSSSQGISTVSPTSANRNTTVSVTITLNSSYTLPPPPTTVQPTAVTLTRTGATTISATSYSRNTSTGVVTASFTIPSTATTGSYTVNATFGPNTWSMTNGFTVN